MTDDDGLMDSLDQQVRDYGRLLRRAASPQITADDLRSRGFRPIGDTGKLHCRWVGQLRLDALPDRCGNYTRLEVYGGPGFCLRFRLASLVEWDVWLATFEREYPGN